jgi:TonB family protein
MVLGLVFALRAQSGEQPGRKVIWSEKPDYPAVLKNARIGGLVRLRVTVQANGTVANIGILGGSPILAECAVKSVMKWKYAPAASRSNEIVTIEFGIR